MYVSVETIICPTNRNMPGVKDKAARVRDDFKKRLATFW